MEVVREYIDTSRYLKSLESELIDTLHQTLGLKKDNIKSIQLDTVNTYNTVRQIIVIRMRGNNTFRSEDLSKIKGLRFVTPNRLEIDGGVTYL